VHTLVSQTSPIYVMDGATGNGTSWSDATGDLSATLQNATANTEIWVAAGTYFPIICTDCTIEDRKKSFVIPEGVQVYGGFEGTETALSQRNWELNPTYLSGNIDQVDSIRTNSYSVIYTNGVSENTIVDGLIITEGIADSVALGYGSIFNSGAGWFNKGSDNSERSNPTIRNCKFVDNESLGYGGAIVNDGSLGGSTAPIFENCVFDNNYSYAGGGAICNRGNNGGNTAPIIRNCVFTNNEAEKDGGAILSLGSDNGMCSTTISNSFFEYNTSQAHGGAVNNFARQGTANGSITNCIFQFNFGNIGAGVYNNGALNGINTTSISDCTFQFNMAGSAGGALYNQGDENGSCNPSIMNCQFIENESGGSGPAIFNNGIDGVCNPTYVNCIIKNNHAGTYGAGMYNIGKNGECLPTITNCLISGNTALSAGGIYCLGSLNGNCSPTITNCTITGNEAMVGGGVYCNAGDTTGMSNAIITNTIIYGNTAEFGSVFRCIYGKPIINHCLVDADDCGALNSGLGADVQCGTNILFNENPLFMDVSNQDFHLRPGSPLLDMGDNMAITGMGVDLDSLSRINNGTVDLGPYEFYDDVYNPPAIVENPSNYFNCAGNSINLEVAVSGSGPLSYQWFKDEVEITAATNPIYNKMNAGTNDSGIYQCRIIGAQQDSIWSEIANVSIQANLNLVAEISSDVNEICSGEIVTFSAGVVNGGNNATYDWAINGESIGINTPQFSSTELTSDDWVAVFVTSNEACLNNSFTTSNSLNIQVEETQNLDIDLEASSTSICAGENISFEASSNYTGDFSYQWKINGSIISNTTSIFSSSNLVNGDEITCTINSQDNCLEDNSVSAPILEISVEENFEVDINIETTNNSVCEGETILFAAIAENEGTDPIYQWYINGNEVGTNSPNLEMNTFEDEDIIYCEITSSLSCTSNPIVSSNSVSVEIAPTLEASIEIAASTIEICEGESISFTSTTINSGNTPEYQWLINGNLIDSLTNNVLTLDNFDDGDIVECILTSSATCVDISDVISNKIPISVNEIISPSIEIEASTLQICEGGTIDFTASLTNGGDSPSLVWMVNGTDIGNNTSKISLANINHEDVITCQLFSDANCINETMVESNSIMIEVINGITASVEIATENTSVCYGAVVNFEAAGSNAGNDGEYSWFVNENFVQNGPDMLLNNLEDGDEVHCELASSLECVSNEIATSIPITMNVMENSIPSISILSNDTEICEGDLVTFIATPVNGGLSPGFQWRKNGAIIATGNPIYYAQNLEDGDIISCVLMSSLECALLENVASNSIETTVIDCTVSNKNLIEDITINTFPNPTNGIFNLVYESSTPIQQIEIMNLQGQVLQRKTTILNSPVELNIQEYSEGVYFVKLMDTDNRIFVERVILQR